MLSSKIKFLTMGIKVVNAMAVLKPPVKINAAYVCSVSPNRGVIYHLHAFGSESPCAAFDTVVWGGQCQSYCEEWESEVLEPQLLTPQATQTHPQSLGDYFYFITTTQLLFTSIIYNLFTSLYAKNLFSNIAHIFQGANFISETKSLLCYI